MPSSLKDQLLNAGLVNQKQAKKASKKSKKNRTLNKEAQAAAEQRKLEQQAKTEEANKKIRLEAEKKAIAAQVKQLIESNALESNGDIKYNFDDQGVIKTLMVSAQQQKQLANGFIGIAKVADSYFMIPATIAEKVEQRGEGYIIVLNTKVEEDEDDPYKDYPIPDDLMW
ncbi:DUF2058 domain-containing protein [Catenovulum sediminis]|uniref:DUF2058 domain-containing protein n=1 Tax=Catenovulum sediminis TaxID=1740262 RepID=A0ABV1RLB8_9ALTE|nr:DUF2058 domain-containing protein [Catenovulum sediminis]